MSPRAPRMHDDDYQPAPSMKAQLHTDTSSVPRARRNTEPRTTATRLSTADAADGLDDDGAYNHATAAAPRAAPTARGQKRARADGLQRSTAAALEDEGDEFDDEEALQLAVHTPGDTAADSANSANPLTYQAKVARMDASEWFGVGMSVEVCEGTGWEPGTIESIKPGHATVHLLSGRQVECSPDDTHSLRPGRPSAEPKPLGQYKQGERIEVWRELNGVSCWCRAEVLAAEPQRVTVRSPDTEETIIVEGSEDIRSERMWDGYGKWRAASKKRPYFEDQDPYIKLIAECSKCRSSYGRRCMVKCSSCPRHWHTYCLEPPAEHVPPKPWRCPQCENELKDDTAEEAARVKGNVDVIIGQRQSGDGGGLEFLIKYDKRGYKDAEWLPERAVRALADRKLKAFWRKHGMDGCEAHFPDDYCRVDRVITAVSGPLNADIVGAVGTANAAVGNVEQAAKPPSLKSDDDDDMGDANETGAGIQHERKGSNAASGVNSDANSQAWLPPPPPPSGADNERVLLVKWQSLGYEQATWEWLSEVRCLTNGEAEIRAYDHRVQQPQSHPGKSAKVLERFNEQPEAVAECGKLHGHQLEGVNWLLQKLQAKQGAILGDEMGLGKTIQAGAFLSVAYAERLVSLPTLIVAPLSTLSSWSNELKQWCPTLNVVTYVGSAESRQLIRHYELGKGSPRMDVLLTSYEVANQDSWMFLKMKFSINIVDEGHRLKSAESKLSRTLSSVNDEFRLILTGTPLQNNLEELFALLHFIAPQSYQDPSALAQAFTKQPADTNGAKVETPSSFAFDGKKPGEATTGKHASRVQNEDNAQLNESGGQSELSDLHELLRKHMLRRLKREVMPDMPLKRKREVHCGLSSLQQSLYADVLARNHKAVNLFNTSNKRVSLINVLKELQKVCNHPFLFPGVEPEAKKAEEGTSLLIEASGKLCVLAKLLPRLRADGHRCLLFCQMTQMLDVLEDFMREMGFPYCRIDGSTSSKERQQVIDRFNANDSDVFIFLISTRAGGLGINLPSADTVFIYDPDFNPFVDLQAQGRAHRIGQRREVMVYQLVTDGSVEEQILAKAKKKLAIERLVVREKGSESISSDELKGILTHGAVNLLNKARGASGESGGIAGTARLYATDNIIETLLDRENAPVVEDDVESQGYLGKIEAQQETGNQQQQDEAAEDANESSALDQLLQERNAKIEAQEIQDESNEAGRPRRRQARNQTVNNPPEGKLADDDDGDEDRPVAGKSTRAVPTQRGEEAELDDWETTFGTRRRRSKYGNLPWVKELSETQLEELKELVRTQGDLAVQGDKIRAQGNLKVGYSRAPSMTQEERKALEAMGLSQQQFVIAEPLNYYMSPMEAPPINGKDAFVKELDYPDIPFAGIVDVQALASQGPDPEQQQLLQQQQQQAQTESAEAWGARNFKEVLPHKFIWQQVQKGYRVTKGAVNAGLKKIARYHNYRWRLLEDEPAMTSANGKQGTQRQQTKSARIAATLAAADDDNYDPELEG